MWVMGRGRERRFRKVRLGVWLRRLGSWGVGMCGILVRFLGLGGSNTLISRASVLVMIPLC